MRYPQSPKTVEQFIKSGNLKKQPLSEELVELYVRWLKDRYRCTFLDLPPDESFNMYDLAALALTITIPDLPEMILFAIVILLMSAYYLSAFSTCSAVAVSHSAVIFVPSAVYSVCRTTDRSIRKETILPRS